MKAKKLRKLIKKLDTDIDNAADACNLAIEKTRIFMNDVEDLATRIDKRQIGFIQKTKPEYVNEPN